MKPNTLARNQYPIRLSIVFTKEYSEVMPHYELPQKIELTEHLIDMLKTIGNYAETKDKEICIEFDDKQTVLKKKYGKAFKPFSAKQFYLYFSFQLIISFKGLVSNDEYNNIPEGGQELTVMEIQAFVQLSLDYLYWALDNLEGQKEPEFEIVQSKAPLPEPEINDQEDKDITKARQLLTIYYLLKAGFGIEHRDSNSVSQIAKFVHLMTGTKFTTIQKSDIYKKYLQMPEYNKDLQLIKDLNFIRPFFVELGINKAVDMIDTEVLKAKKALPHSKRKSLKE